MTDPLRDALAEALHEAGINGAFADTLLAHPAVIAALDIFWADAIQTQDAIHAARSGPAEGLRERLQIGIGELGATIEDGQVARERLVLFIEALSISEDIAVQALDDIRILSDAARSTATPGRHDWTTDDDHAYEWCRVCLNVRQRNGSSDAKSCKGPARIGLRAATPTASPTDHTYRLVEDAMYERDDGQRDAFLSGTVVTLAASPTAGGLREATYHEHLARDAAKVYAALQSEATATGEGS